MAVNTLTPDQRRFLDKVTQLEDQVKQYGKHVDALDEGINSLLATLADFRSAVNEPGPFTVLVFQHAMYQDVYWIPTARLNESQKLALLHLNGIDSNTCDPHERAEVDEVIEHIDPERGIRIRDRVVSDLYIHTLL